MYARINEYKFNVVLAIYLFIEHSDRNCIKYEINKSISNKENNYAFII